MQNIVSIKSLEELDNLKAKYKTDFYEDVYLGSELFSYAITWYIIISLFSIIVFLDIIIFIKIHFLRWGDPDVSNFFSYLDLITVVLNFIFFGFFFLILNGSSRRRTTIYFFDDYLLVNAQPVSSADVPLGGKNFGTFYRLPYTNAQIKYNKKRKTKGLVDFTIVGEFEVLIYKRKLFGGYVEVEKNKAEIDTIKGEYYEKKDIKEVFKEYTTIENVEQLEKEKINVMKV